MTTIAVTGASGLIGRHLIAALRERGDTVVALSRRDQLIAGVRSTPWDPDSEELPTAARTATVVINLAGAGIADGRWGPPHRRAIEESRRITTRRVVDAMDGPTVLVSGSAIGYYGPGDTPVDETAPAGDDFLASVCGHWEDEANRAREAGVRVVLLRSGIVLARDGGVFPRLRLPAQWGVGGPLGSGRQWISWIHIADEVGAILLALDRTDLKGPLNAVAPTPVRQREFARTLGRVLHRPAVVHTPAVALRVVLGGASQMATTGQCVVPAVLSASGFTFRFATVESALRDVVAPSDNDRRA